MILAKKALIAPVEFKQKSGLNLETSRGALIAGLGIVGLTLMLYVIFSTVGMAR
jgi:hypothetical protein